MSSVPVHLRPRPVAPAATAQERNVLTGNASPQFVASCRRCRPQRRFAARARRSDWLRPAERRRGEFRQHRQCPVRAPRAPHARNLAACRRRRSAPRARGVRKHAGLPHVAGPATRRARRDRPCPTWLGPAEAPGRGSQFHQRRRRHARGLRVPHTRARRIGVVAVQAPVAGRTPVCARARPHDTHAVARDRDVGGRSATDWRARRMPRTRNRSARSRSGLTTCRRRRTHAGLPHVRGRAARSMPSTSTSFKAGGDRSSCTWPGFILGPRMGLELFATVRVESFIAETARWQNSRS